MALAEAEVKYEISAEEFRQMPAVLRELGFTWWKDEALTDYYLYYATSPVRGYDYTRVREVDGELTLTRKAWEPDLQGHPVRLEEERALSRAEFTELLATAGDAPVLRKHRTSYRGTIDDDAATVVLDTLHRDATVHYYLECEMLVPPEHAHDARTRLAAWVHATLPVSSDHEAPSMLELLLAG